MSDGFLRVIDIKKSEWDKLMAHVDRDKWTFPITLSSNGMGEVWYSRKHGYHHESDREYISYYDYPFLADIHDEVLKSGGLFLELNRHMANHRRKLSFH